MRTTIALAVLFAALTACPYGGPKGDVSQNSPSKTTTTTTNSRAGADRSSSMNPVTPVNKDIPSKRPGEVAEFFANVELTEYAIHIPPVLVAGHERFHIVNAGKESHNFVITGNGVSAQLPDDLPRGDTNDVVIDLKPGTYTVFCPVDGHRGKGMQTTVTVVK